MPVPVISVAQMREWEKVTWASGQSEEAVMRRAGEAIARQAERMTKRGERIIVLAGKGHNGDDARFAAEGMRERKVEVVRVVDPEAVAGGDSEVAFHESRVVYRRVVRYRAESSDGPAVDRADSETQRDEHSRAGSRCSFRA
jgi:NAD(P)H-hydrate repair Nnr-like enzyme with NAD(P)H-hydrate epimerase domain